MPSTSQPSLPTNRAFVVQLHADTQVEQGEFRGRVEHVVSMQATHFHSLEELVAFMVHVVALFVDKSSQQWVVRDPEGNFWLVPAVENPWDHRQPFDPAEETGLNPIPGHYKYILDLPF